MKTEQLIEKANTYLGKDINTYVIHILDKFILDSCGTFIPTHVLGLGSSIYVKGLDLSKSLMTGEITNSILPHMILGNAIPYSESIHMRHDKDMAIPPEANWIFISDAYIDDIVDIFTHLLSNDSTFVEPIDSYDIEDIFNELSMVYNQAAYFSKKNYAVITCHNVKDGRTKTSIVYRPNKFTDNSRFSDYVLLTYSNDIVPEGKVRITSWLDYLVDKLEETSKTG